MGVLGVVSLAWNGWANPLFTGQTEADLASEDAVHVTEVAVDEVVKGSSGATPEQDAELSDDQSLAVLKQNRRDMAGHQAGGPDMDKTEPRSPPDKDPARPLTSSEPAPSSEGNQDEQKKKKKTKKEKEKKKQKQQPESKRTTAVEQQPESKSTTAVEQQPESTSTTAVEQQPESKSTTAVAVTRTDKSTAKHARKRASTSSDIPSSAPTSSRGVKPKVSTASVPIKRGGTPVEPPPRKQAKTSSGSELRPRKNSVDEGLPSGGGDRVHPPRLSYPTGNGDRPPEQIIRVLSLT